MRVFRLTPGLVMLTLMVVAIAVAHSQALPTLPMTPIHVERISDYR